MQNEDERVKCAGVRDPAFRARGLSGAGDIPRARPFGRAGPCPMESHLSHLIPLNPGGSRTKIKFGPRWAAEPDRDGDETCGRTAAGLFGVLKPVTMLAHAEPRIAAGAGPCPYDR